MVYPFSELSRKSLPIPRSQNFSPIFSSVSFIIFSSGIVIHFKLHSVYGVRLGTRFIYLFNYFTYSYPIVPAEFVEKNKFFTVKHLGSFVENRLTIHVCLFLNSVLSAIHLDVYIYANVTLPSLLCFVLILNSGIFFSDVVLCKLF